MNVNTFVIKKINRIFIPYIFFTLLSFVMELCFGKLNPSMPFNGPLWFLETIFVAMVIYVILHLYIQNDRIIGLTSFAMLVFAVCASKYTTWAFGLPFSLTRAFAAVFFIHLGYVLKDLPLKMSKVKIAVSTLFCVVIYVLGLILSLLLFETKGSHFLDMRIFTYCFPLAIFTTCAGVFATVSLSRLVGKFRFLNWLGKNSLVIMCVHFPIIERLNSFCAASPYYSSMYTRVVLAALCYAFTIGFSSIFAVLCKYYIPQVSGYKKLLN